MFSGDRLMKYLFTIGYSSYSKDSLIEVLKKHSIDVVADVRSQPYSQYKPEFNREPLSNHLQKNKIQYVFLGDLCGARISAEECYVNGTADYELIAKHPKFKRGIQRLQKGLKKYRIVLLCAEKDPVTCHRTILVCKNLKSTDLEINHILEDGKLESHNLTEQRLMKLLKLDHPNLFKTYQQRLEEAYNLQGKKISYNIDDVR